MTNICENFLFVTSINGDYDQVKRFVDEVKDPEQGEAISFECYYDDPYNLDIWKEYNEWFLSLDLRPSTFKDKEFWELMDHYKIRHLKSPGPAWCAESEILETKSEPIIYSFISASEPPIKYLIKMASLYPDLYFVLKYESGGYVGVCQICGDYFSDLGPPLN